MTIKKRGISPLIATILLIGFTVILAAIIFTWGQGWFGGLTESASESTTLQLACINKGGLTISGVCDDTTSSLGTRVTITNTGILPHATCSLATVGLSPVDCGTLAAGGIGVSNIGTTTALGSGEKIISTFTIDLGVSGTATCQGSSYTAGELNPC